MILISALLFGIVAGLRALTAPAAVSWAASSGRLALAGSGLAFLGYRYAPILFTALALVEFVTDQLPGTPSRKVPVQFGARLGSGAFCGAAVGAAHGQLVGGILAGVLGAVLGTFAGAELRGRLATHFGQDRPAAVLEDILAIALAAAAVFLV